MNFVLLGEMATRVSESTRSLNLQIQWSEIRAFRNLVAHEYLGIDAEEVWQTIHDDIPALRRSLQKLLDAPRAVVCIVIMRSDAHRLNRQSFYSILLALEKP